MGRRAAVRAGTLLALLTSAWALADTVRFQDGVSPTPAYTGTRDLRLSTAGYSFIDPNANKDGANDNADGDPSDRATLISFDVSAIPAGSTVTAATLDLDVNNLSGELYPLYEVLVPWVASEATFNRASAGMAWSVPGAANPGVDRGTTVLGSITAPATGHQTFALNAAGIALVQRWVDAPATNRGLIVQQYDNANGIDWSNCDDATATNRLALVVTYDAGTTVTFQNGVSPTTAYAGCKDDPIGRSPSQSGNFNGLDLSLFKQTAEDRIALSFDLSAVPAAAQITGASLELTVYNADADPAPIFELLRPWDEQTASWTTTDGGALWELAGADGPTDRGSVVLGTLTPTPVGLVTAALNADGIALVQAWVDGTKPNMGLLLLTPNAGTPHALIRDRESLIPSEHPALVLTYVVDGGVADGGLGDGGLVDGGLVDGGESDAGQVDGGTLDAGIDAGPAGGSQDASSAGPDGGLGRGPSRLVVDCGCHAGAPWIALGLIALLGPALSRRRAR